MSKILNDWGGESAELNEMTEMIGSTSLSQVLDNAVATGAMTLLVNREFKTSKNGDSASLKKWLNSIFIVEQ